MSLRRYRSPDTLGQSRGKIKISPQRDNILLLFLWLFLSLTGCGDVEHDGYYPNVHSIKVSVGKDYIDVTIRGLVNNIGDFISDVEVIKVGREIILIPIAYSSGSAPAHDPFEETIRIDALKGRQYLITVIGEDETTGERTVITKKVEVK